MLRGDPLDLFDDQIDKFETKNRGFRNSSLMAYEDRSSCWNIDRMEIDAHIGQNEKRTKPNRRSRLPKILYAPNIPSRKIR